MADIEALEAKIARHPNNISFRVELLKTYFFSHPELHQAKAPRDQVLQTIEILSSEDQELVSRDDLTKWATFFLAHPPSIPDVTGIWNSKLAESSQHPWILESAGVFLLNANPEFSASCFEILLMQRPQDTEVMEFFARALYRAKDYPRACSFFNDRISLKTEIEPIVLTEAVICASKASLQQLFSDWKKKLKELINNNDHVKEVVDDLLAQEDIK